MEIAYLTLDVFLVYDANHLLYDVGVLRCDVVVQYVACRFGIAVGLAVFVEEVGAVEVAWNWYIKP